VVGADRTKLRGSWPNVREESAGTGGKSVHGVAEGRTPVILALAARHPALWHCCFIGAWPGICVHGLQSVASLAELAQVPSQLRGHMLRQRRTQSERLELPDGHQAVLRDQAPLRSRKLGRHLEDMGEEDWFTLLNARVFLFTQERHVRRLLAAYADEGQDVIKLKTSALLAACGDRVEVATVNSGALPRTSSPSRGRRTFVPLATFPANNVAMIQEVTVLGGINDIQPLTTSVIRHHPDGTKRRIWP
jgi:hypothetical protein